jgi:hypothetical protein
MGNKPSFIYQSDRPESGGSDRDGIRENNGLLDKAKEKFAQEKAEEREERPGKDQGPGSRAEGSDRQ